MNVMAPWDPYNSDPEQHWADDEFSDFEERPADLVSIGYIRAALRRRARLWCTLAFVGLLAGFGVLVTLPPAYQASSSLLLTTNPAEIPTEAILDSQAIAQSRTVAGLAAERLGLPQNSLIGHYTVTALTERVLLITVSAKSTATAVREANALATAFLRFQANLLETQQRLVNAQLQQQVTQAQQEVNSLSSQISKLELQPASPNQRSDLSGLRNAHSQAVQALVTLQQSNQSNQATTETNTAKMIQGSQVLDKAAPIHRSQKKLMLVYLGTGLIAGLALGMGLVIVWALLSDRLRQRNDVARVLGAPVKLSVGKVRLGRWRFGRSGLAAAQDPAVRRIVAHLDSVAPASSRGMALAVVPVDDPLVAALSVASLAISRARQGSSVVVTDLCSGSPAARLLGTTAPGVTTVHIHDAQLVVAISERDDIMPAGPLQHGSGLAQVSEPLVAACRSADLLLTLAALDPAFGGDHLETWATSAVAVVTAGRSSAERIHAVGEMIRTGRTALISAVLVGADKTDESLGVTGLADASEAHRSIEVAARGLHSDADSILVRANGAKAAESPKSDDAQPEPGEV